MEEAAMDSLAGCPPPAQPGDSMNPTDRRRPRQFQPLAERCEPRLLLAADLGQPSVAAVLTAGGGFPAVRPNTPLLPIGAQSNVVSFIDPTAQITHGKHVVLGNNNYIAPFVVLDARSPGFIKVGNGSTIQDDAVIQGNPNRIGNAGVIIGNGVFIGPGATVRGPAQVGALGLTPSDTAAATVTTNASVGANALIDGAVISPGAFVGPLARVGPGVTVPAGMYVLPGVNVTTNAQATNPALGFVRAVTAADVSTLKTELADSVSLANGYASLYQGNTATGASTLITATGINNGNLTTIEGSSGEPGPGTTAAPIVKFEPSAAIPSYLTTAGKVVKMADPFFRARVIGNVFFAEPSRVLAHHLGRGNSIRADEGQPFKIGSVAQTGARVSIHAPISGTITIGLNFTAGDNARILASPTADTKLGNGVNVGSGAVINSSTIGNGSVIGPRSYISTSTLPPGTVIPPGTILVGNKVVGTIQW